MRKKIKNSLSIKVFLWVFSALTICSMLIYGLVLSVLPKQYQITSDKKLDKNTEILVSKLQNMPYDDAVKEIYNFCIQNNSTAVLSGDDGVLCFGEIETEELTVATSSIASTVTFSDNKKEYALVISSLSQTADIILSLMLRFLPAVFAIILLLSFLSAFLCSRVIVTFITKISQLSEDVEKFKSLEEQRKNFFAAVSHELKTPLTILKGQIENMILGYGDYQDHEKYLPEAYKTAEDIEHLVKEIITISKMESMDLQDTLQEVSLKQLTNDTIQAILPLAQDKDIQIHQNINADIVLSVNPNLCSKALSNIIGNAVRHSPCGENVFISVQPCKNGNFLVIENTGVSIPEADFPHMFTPFYRADKSRNKATGGSGLGLYIVKTIFDLHGMTYYIKNTDQGVAFFLYLN